MHLAIRVTVLDPAFSGIAFFPDDAREIVWNAIEEEAKSLLILLPLSGSEQNVEYGNESCVITSSAAAARLHAVGEALK